MWLAADPCHMTCPLQGMLDPAGSKWAIPVLCGLRQGPVRTGALLRQVGGIAQTMATRTRPNPLRPDPPSAPVIPRCQPAPGAG